MAQEILHCLTNGPSKIDKIVDECSQGLLGGLRKQSLSIEKLLQNLVDEIPIEEYHVDNIESTFAKLQSQWNNLRQEHIQGVYL